MKQQELIPHLFRTEYSKITAVLCRRFGFEHIEVAEDIASETFLAAMESWAYKGLPENPVAWLYTVAKNKAATFVNRNSIFQEHVAKEVVGTAEEYMEIDLSEKNITDSQLQMLFVICNPIIPVESQIGLSLRILCGFGIDEIADAFLTNKETVNKRLYRAREKLRQERVKIELPHGKEIESRIQSVLLTLYLLFSEGYYSESTDSVIRKGLCLEAMRLTYLLLENRQTNLPAVNALLALMCFQASRFDARLNVNNDFVLYHDQDENLWNHELINRGILFLNKAAIGKVLSKYHIEAGIAYWHTVKNDSIEKWKHILQLFNQLLVLQYSPIAALNRTYAFSKIYGNQAAIAEAEKLSLTTNHFYFTLLGELYQSVDTDRAKENFDRALVMAKSVSDKKIIQDKIDKLISRL